MAAVICSRKLVSTYKMAWYSNPDDHNTNLKSLMLLITSCYMLLLSPKQTYDFDTGG